MNSWLSIYLIAPLAGWFCAHVIKFLLNLIGSGGKRHDLAIFLRAGGMPSSHSAVTVAALTVVGARQGVGSAIFGLAAVVTAIVIYDAINVRRSVGEQGDVLRKVIAHVKLDERFRIAYGHTFPEVIVGVIVGFVVGVIMLQIL